MTELDKALEIFKQETDEAGRAQYYDLFLNSVFFVPTHEDQTHGEEDQSPPKGHVIPLIIEAEGKDYLMLFDTKERLRDWAQEEVSFVEVHGYVIAEMSAPPLHWALNVGAEHSKEFVPEEITWLREVVEHCNAKAQKEQKKQE